ncbi:MAG: radical SAM protein, partial [Thermodesulfobacteriota bacterium]|nr:radical SAM protein [Thermodesulfobacteriota bacterium]
IAFGPVPSRRLGISLGINNIPPKICTYACVYCQLGRAIKMQTSRQAFYSPTEIGKSVRKKVEKIYAQGGHIDYLTIVPDGEPTLDILLSEQIKALRPLDIKIAVITNGSLLYREEVRDALSLADWVSVKVDCVIPEIWRRLDHPYKGLELGEILEGIQAFAQVFTGRLVTETMLVRGLNDEDSCLEESASFIQGLSADTSYLSIPTRPPADSRVLPPDEGQINRAFQVFSNRLKKVEYLIGYEGNEFSSTGDIREDVLGITSVHPMRADAIDALLQRYQGDWAEIKELVNKGDLIETSFSGYTFYVRALKKKA